MPSAWLRAYRCPWFVQSSDGVTLTNSTLVGRVAEGREGLEGEAKRLGEPTEGALPTTANATTENPNDRSPEPPTNLDRGTLKAFFLSAQG